MPDWQGRSYALGKDDVRNETHLGRGESMNAFPVSRLFLPSLLKWEDTVGGPCKGMRVLQIPLEVKLLQASRG